MNSFSMNGYFWKVQFVEASDPMLMDRTGKRTVATTDPVSRTVYLANVLYGDFLMKVLIHELGHCALVSFNLLDDLHRMVKPQYWVEAEEWACNLLADFGFQVFSIAFDILGYDAWKEIPKSFDRLIA